jgi:arylsulfatase A-like enzyme
MTHYEGPVQPERSSDYVRQMMGLSPRDEHFEGIPWDDADRYYMQALYDGGIVQTDELLGELIGALDRNPRFGWAHDILVLFSDHGEEFWDHGSLGHGKTLFQEALHVPLVMRLPGAGVGGRRIPEVVMLMDVAPTLLELARVPVPSSFTGSSLLPLLTGDGERGNRIAVSQTVDQLASMIQFPWKLIRYGQEDRLELYNLEVDPGEHLPLQDDHAALANQLQEALMTQIREGREIPVFIEAEDVDDQALREQLRSLGYID